MLKEALLFIMFIITEKIMTKLPIDMQVFTASSKAFLRATPKFMLWVDGCLVVVL
ncbi:hypothetical protein SDC9_194364 [bioreactor metagenome]|uniref:Uncharacterized protein n=1 Tax=bioreactor metagenome TaxID=1076179 RepID=A0A645I790_9ZZZZ